MATNDNQKQTQATINFVADVLKKSPNPTLREASKQMRAQTNLSDAITLAEEAATSTNPNNSLVGNLAVLVGNNELKHNPPIFMVIFLNLVVRSTPPALTSLFGQTTSSANQRQLTTKQALTHLVQSHGVSR